MKELTREELEEKVGQAYQVIGGLLSACGKFDTDQGQATLDYFSQDVFDRDFLPWPKDPDWLR